MTATELARALGGRTSGATWQARCPGHEDDRASLSIGAGQDGRVLLKCHAGCSLEQILAGVNRADVLGQPVTVAALFPPTPRPSRSRVVATYDYRDEQNKLLYQVVRYTPKDFKQRRPDGDGWLWTLGDVRRVLFGLPELRAQLKTVLGKFVYVCEGENDALALRGIGLIATTNAGGASKNPAKPKWRAEYTAQLQAAGARGVYVLPDHDDAGRAHAEAIARSCHLAALPVKIVALPGLPEKGDVSDWLATGHTRDELVELAQAAAVFSADARSPHDGEHTSRARQTEAALAGARVSEPVADDQEAGALGRQLEAVEHFVRRYMVLSADASTLVALWIAQTHALDAFDYVPYLAIKSPLPECGKTRLLEVLEALVHRPWLTGRVTAAVLMRKVDAEHPVLLLDESDAAFNAEKEYAEALRGMLNSGFHRSGKASACVGQGANLSYKDFATFGPKAIAGLGVLPPTVESRSIPIALKRRTKAEPVTKWRRREGWTLADGLRKHLGRTMGAHHEALRGARPAMPSGLSDRAEDVLEPLLAIADVAGGDWPVRARSAEVQLMGHAARTAHQTDQDFALELLADIFDVFTANGNPDALPTEDLLSGLTRLEERPWATFTKGEQPLNSNRLSRILKTFEVYSAGNIRFPIGVKRGYRRAAFEDAFARYLPSKALQRNNVNNDGPETPKTEALPDAPVADPRTAISRDKHCVCSAVALAGADMADTRPTAEDERDGVF